MNMLFKDINTDLHISTPLILRKDVEWDSLMSCLTAEKFNIGSNIVNSMKYFYCYVLLVYYFSNYFL